MDEIWFVFRRVFRSLSIFFYGYDDLLIKMPKPTEKWTEWRTEEKNRRVLYALMFWTWILTHAGEREIDIEYPFAYADSNCFSKNKEIRNK